VNNDIYEAQQVGVRGVPFFVFDNKYAVSGAQSSQLFSDVLNKIWNER
jgi:predicted DsbA family dithiol-disulfide isomerase